MSVLLLLPGFDLGARDFRRCLASLEVNLPGEPVILGGLGSWSARHAEAFGVAVAEIDLRRLDPAITQIALIAANDQDPIVTVVTSSLGERAGRTSLFRFSLAHPYFRARLEPLSIPDYRKIYPAWEAHAFNRLSPTGTDFFYYFPYGYLFRELGVGPLNEFGMRIAQDLSDLRDRAPDHKLVILYGGSAAWSLDCLHTEMMTHRLELRLRAWTEAQAGRPRFTVVNMGQHGNVVLNEILNQILFADELKPDIVIGHDGFNDMCYGVVNDTALLSQHKICYQNNLEGWSQLLHNSQNRPVTGEGERVINMRNSPQAVINAYLFRKRQLADLVTAKGGKFLWGLQPFMGSKGALHPDEAAYHASHRPYETPLGNGFQNMKMLFDQISERMDRLDADIVNVHRAFHAFGADEYLFADNVHLSPEGEERIAGLYFDVITSKVDSGAWFAA